ncbi:Flp pilus assembly protein CpaB [Klenkia brasiliensis]|uniref:Pilus assembly protein CpaB n=1 Tax=Klenkia brasiliensis TaxID=333142 RepID=A0A1G7V214_9ACTN|nr:RcpC/CpaB family pilus assembly protein [Klenkia brasiliensis]SDG53010.1 pilus assembly protein CpaB [Klenkia brasiliensis]
MNRRTVAALAAVVLAAVGAWVILTYVKGADARAQAAESLTSVYVVGQDVPSGTPAADLAAAVGVAQVPTRLVAEGAVTDLATLDGLVTTTELLPGDQLQAARFATPDARRTDGSLPAPDGTEEVSLALEGQRAVGGVLTPGDLVAVFGSHSTINDGPDVSFELDGVLVTRVVAPTDASGVWVVTLAVDPAQAGNVAAAQSAGTTYLALQKPGTPAAASTGLGSLGGGSDATDSTTPTTGSASTGGNS